MDNSYSPVSPYHTTYENSRTYASKGRKMFSYLTGERTKHLRITLAVVALISFIVAVFFTVLHRRDFTMDELNGSWKRLAGVIAFTKSSKGKVLVAFLWIVFILTVIPAGAGVWFRRHEKNFF